jgi:hypothetical protein
LELEHSEQLNGLSPARFEFNVRNGKDHGECIMKASVGSCLIETEFNERARRYERLCPNPACKTSYVEMFRKNMVARFGKTHILDDPEQQKVMLAARSISDVYEWRDGKTKTTYTGKEELRFLQFMDLSLEWPPEGLIMPCPLVFIYRQDGTNHNYLPDFYVPSIDLVGEIKATNPHYQRRDAETEDMKERAVRATKKPYIKVVDGNYDEFLTKLLKNDWK